MSIGIRAGKAWTGIRGTSFLALILRPALPASGRLPAAAGNCGGAGESRKSSGSSGGCTRPFPPLRSQGRCKQNWGAARRTHQTSKGYGLLGLDSLCLQETSGPSHGGLEVQERGGAGGSEGPRAVPPPHTHFSLRRAGPREHGCESWSHQAGSLTWSLPSGRQSLPVPCPQVTCHTRPKTHAGTEGPTTNLFPYK